MKIAIESYVCDAMIPWVEKAANDLINAGHKITSAFEADLIIIASCVLNSRKERQILERLSEIKNAGKKVLVAGCMVDVKKDLIKSVNEKASVCGNASYFYLTDIVEKIASGYQVERFSDKPLKILPQGRMRTNPKVAYIPLQEGCSRFCTFCACKFARGTLESYEPNQIIAAAERAVNTGAREIVLVGEDIACYGEDIKSVRLPAIIRKLCSLKGDFKIKLGYMNPASVLPILDDLISVMAHPKVYRYLHLNLISGSDHVLKKTERGYTKREFMEIVNAFRKKYPLMTIESDVMVGHCSESDIDFEETINVVKQAKIDILNVYPYTQHWFERKLCENEVVSWKIKERYEKMLKIKETLENGSSQKWIGWNGECILVDETKEYYVLRNHACRDVLISKYSCGNLGNMASSIKVEVVKAKNAYLFGKILN